MLGNCYPLKKGLLLLLLLSLPQGMCYWSGLWVWELRLCAWLMAMTVPDTEEVCSQWISLEFEHGTSAPPGNKSLHAITCSISWVGSSQILCVLDTSDGTDTFRQLWVSSNCHSIPAMEERCLPISMKATTMVPPCIWMPFVIVVGG